MNSSNYPTDMSQEKTNITDSQVKEQNKSLVTNIQIKEEPVVPIREVVGVRQLKLDQPFLIKAKITKKSELEKSEEEPINDSKFIVELLDKDGDEIKVIFYGEAAELYFPQIQVNQVYFFWGGTLKPESSLDQTKNRGPYNLIFEKPIPPCLRKVENKAHNMFNIIKLCKIKDLPNLPLYSLVDLAAFVMEPPPRNQDAKGKVVLSLYDDSKKIVNMNYLSKEIMTSIAKEFAEDQIIIIKDACVSNCGGGISLCSTILTRIMTTTNEIPSNNDLIPAIEELIEWKMRECDMSSLSSISVDQRLQEPFYSIEEIFSILERKELNASESISFNLSAIISYIPYKQEKTIYTACINKNKCAKKVMPVRDGWYSCSSCSLEFKEPAYRFSLDIKLSDQTGSIWANAFDNVSKFLLGTDADSVKNFQENMLIEVFRKPLLKEFRFRLSAKRNGSHPSVLIKVDKVEEVIYSKHGKNILEELDKYQNYLPIF